MRWIIGIMLLASCSTIGDVTPGETAPKIAVPLNLAQPAPLELAVYKDVKFAAIDEKTLSISTEDYLKIDELIFVLQNRIDILQVLLVKYRNYYEPKTADVVD